AGILLAEAAEHAVGAARIEREDRLEMRRLLLGDVELFGTEAGNAHHADVAVAPWLGRDPFDQIVAVPFTPAAALRFADPARGPDHMDVAARDEEMRVARLQRTRPQRRPCWLRRQRLGHVRALEVLVVDGEGEKGGELLLGVRTVNIDAQ